MKNETVSIASSEKEETTSSPLGNAIIPAADVLIHDPGSIDTFREGGKNTLFITWPVWLQLKDLRNKPEIGIDAKECIARIEELRKNDDPSLVIWKKISNGIKFLSKKELDDQVIAAAISIKKEFRSTRKFQHFKFLCRDPFSRTTAREVDNNGLVVENYHHDRVDIDDISNIKSVDVSEADFYTDDVLIYRPETFGKLEQNEGVICRYNNGDDLETFAAIRKDFYLQIIPKDISAFGIKPRPLFDGSTNWAQHIAFQQLLDPEIKLVFLEGSAGTGKTLIALACALAQKSLYTQIALTRPMVPLEDEDKMGFLPGKVEDKIAPWIRPLWIALQFLNDNKEAEPTKIDPEKTEQKKSELKKSNPKSQILLESEAELNGYKSKGKIRVDKRKRRREEKIKKSKETSKNYELTGNGRGLTVEQLRFRNNIIIEPLGYIRGITLPGRTYLILDEGQNTTPHAIKTIITRAGEGTKIVITGDLSQIDLKSLRRLDKNSNGLAHAMAKMRHEIVATTRFESSDSVRSLLAKLATERL